jgi:hypothetical protein
MRLYKVTQGSDRWGWPKEVLTRPLNRLIGQNYRWLEKSVRKGSRVELVAMYKKRRPKVLTNDLFFEVDDNDIITGSFLGGHRVTVTLTK